MRKFLVEIQFNGKNYYGFQKLNGHATIASKICEALQKLFDCEIDINGCSRTDAGVSAESYFFDFCVDTKLPTERIPFKLNRFLPKDIQAVSAREVEENFHARYFAKSKTYEYRFYLSEHTLPLLNPRCYKLKPTIDLDAMTTACNLFVGKHDFSAFKTTSNDDKSCVRTIFSSTLLRDGNVLTFRICGDGFLYNMVRILAGTLVKIAYNELSLDNLKTLLDQKLPRSSNPALTLPPNALTLKSVEY